FTVTAGSEDWTSCNCSSQYSRTCSGSGGKTYGDSAYRISGGLTCKTSRRAPWSRASEQASRKAYVHRGEKSVGCRMVRSASMADSLNKLTAGPQSEPHRRLEGAYFPYRIDWPHRPCLNVRDSSENVGSLAVSARTSVKQVQCRQNEEAWEAVICVV